MSNPLIANSIFCGTEMLSNKMGKPVVIASSKNSLLTVFIKFT